MPLFMDRHYSENPTREAVELAHLKDLEIQDKYGVKNHLKFLPISLVLL